MVQAPHVSFAVLADLSGNLFDHLCRRRSYLSRALTDDLRFFPDLHCCIKELHIVAVLLHFPASVIEPNHMIQIFHVFFGEAMSFAEGRQRSSRSLPGERKRAVKL